MDVQDEELPGQDRPVAARRTRILLVGAALVVAAGAAVAVLTSGSDPPRTQAAPEATSAVPSVRGPVSSPPKPPCLDVGGSRLNCGITPRLAPTVLAALQTVLPRASVDVASTVVARSGRVYSRQVTVRDVAGATLQVGIGPTTGQHSVITVPSSVAPTLIRFDVDISGHHVAVTFRTGDGGRPPTVAVLRRLAADPRLLTR